MQSCWDRDCLTKSCRSKHLALEGQGLCPTTPKHLTAQVFFSLSWRRDSVPSSAWGGLCLLSTSSRTALIISLEGVQVLNCGQEMAPFTSSDEPSWHQLAGAILSCRSNLFTKKLSHLLLGIHTEFQVLVLKSVSLSLCAWKSWPQQLICASTITAVKKLLVQNHNSSASRRGGERGVVKQIQLSILCLPFYFIGKQDLILY